MSRLGGKMAQWVLAAAAGLWLARPAQGQPEKQVDPDPSRATPVHRIALFDEDGTQIDPDKGTRPISLRITCNKCHDYRKVEPGWHFNSGDPNVAPGRPGQPWILTDVAAGTQIPITGRDWPRTFRPEQVALTSWRFVQRFGRHMPGGDLGDRFALKYPDSTERWVLSGNVEINCLGCHNGERQQDASHYADQMGRENYRWAATAASGLATVGGWVKLLPSTYDPVLGEYPENPALVPRVQYDKSRFNPKKEVFMDLPRKGPVDRCYSCHTNHPAGQDEWTDNLDVHVARGFACADCHRNGLDHQISRNYEGEKDRLGGYSCRACHLGEASAAAGELRSGGRYCAPRPQHAGIPSIHLDRLSCTACHSGPLPQKTARAVQTSRAHGLGFHGMGYSPDSPPYISEPVFVKQYDGKIAPHRMVFPAYWGRMKAGKVTPLSPEAVVKATGQTLATPKGKLPRPPTADQIKAVLKALDTDKEGAAAVYICRGRLYRLDGDKLKDSAHDAASPCSWPLAHDVRPAAQSLGANSACTDCHSDGSPFLFGQVEARGPAELGPPPVRLMHEFHGLDPMFHKLFGLTFVFRPYLKITGFVTTGITAIVVFLFALKGLAAVLRRLGWSARLGRPEP